MADAMNGPSARCPWCSAPLPDPSVERCPSCSATLASGAGLDADIKGVTTLDPEAILRARNDATRPRNRILSFITGDTSSDETILANPESLGPPPDEVKREMLRLQIEAERADLTAETVALKADELERQGIPLSQLGGGPAPASEGDVAPGGDAAPGEPAWPAELTPDAADEPEPPTGS